MVKMKDIKWVEDYVNQAARKRLEKVIETIETTTQTEVVVVLQKRSPASRRLSLIVQIISALGLLYVVLNHSFSQQASLVLGLTFMALLVIPIAERASPLIFRGIYSSVARSAWLDWIADSLFLQRQIQKTQNHTGLLILVSFDDQMLRLRADVGAKDVLGSSELEHMVELLVTAFKKRDFELGLTEALNYAGQKLQKAIPAQIQNPNEISNEIVVLPYY